LRLGEPQRCADPAAGLHSGMLARRLPWIDLINERALAGSRRLRISVACTPTWASPCMTRRSRLGVEVLLQPEAPKRTRSPAADGLPVPDSRPIRQNMPLPRRRGERARLFSAGRSADVPDLAEEAGWSRVLAGSAIPQRLRCRTRAGRKVAEQVIAKAQADGWNPVFTGTVPTGPCLWIGSNPPNFGGATMKPLLLSSPSQFRPALRLPATLHKSWRKRRSFTTSREPFLEVPRYSQPTTKRSTGKARKACRFGPTATPTSGCSKTGSIRIRLVPLASTR
jgi:hypothetical protein